MKPTHEKTLGTKCRWTNKASKEFWMECRLQIVLMLYKVIRVLRFEDAM
jgi:hypothetical protein